MKQKMKVKMNVNFFGMPEPKTNVNSDTQEIITK